MYLFQLFRCKKNNGIKKNGSIWLFQKLGPPGAPEPTLGPKTPLNGPGRAKIGVNASHVVQLTGLGPKKTKFESVRSKVCSFHTESARRGIRHTAYPEKNDFFAIVFTPLHTFLFNAVQR